MPEKISLSNTTDKEKNAWGMMNEAKNKYPKSTVRAFVQPTGDCAAHVAMWIKAIAAGRDYLSNENQFNWMQVGQVDIHRLISNGKQQAALMTKQSESTYEINEQNAIEGLEESLANCKANLEYARTLNLTEQLSLERVVKQAKKGIEDVEKAYKDKRLLFQSYYFKKQLREVATLATEKRKTKAAVKIKKEHSSPNKITWISNFLNQKQVATVNIHSPIKGPIKKGQALVDLVKNEHVGKIIFIGIDNYTTDDGHALGFNYLEDGKSIYFFDPNVGEVFMYADDYKKWILEFWKERTSYNKFIKYEAKVFSISQHK